MRYTVKYTLFIYYNQLRQIAAIMYITKKEVMALGLALFQLLD